MAAKPLVDLLTSPWAIQPQKLVEIQAVYAAHFRGELPDFDAIEARLGRPLASEQQDYRVEDQGVAVLEISGSMAPKANMLMRVSGGVSTQMLTDQINSMRADARVRSVVMVWDSPGGNVQGIPAAGAALRALAAEKPTVSLVRGAMASAAYWVGSAANAVYLEGATDLVGSLGVYSRLTWNDAEPNTKELVRGKYKRVSINGQGPSPEVEAEAEAQMDYLYSVLVDTVADNRGVSSQAVLDHMADGRTFVGQQAIDAGLADGMATLDELIQQLASKPAAFRTRRQAQIVGATAQPQPAQPHQEKSPMSKIIVASMLGQAASAIAAALQAEHPDVVQALQLQAQPSAEALLAAQAEAATAERARIQAVLALHAPGHEALVQKLAFDGKTTAAEAALAVNQADRELAAQRGDDIAKDRPAPLKGAATATGEDAPDDKSADKSPAAVHARARTLANQIAERQAQARAAGRSLSATEALALIQQES